MRQEIREQDPHYVSTYWIAELFRFVEKDASYEEMLEEFRDIRDATDLWELIFYIETLMRVAKNEECGICITKPNVYSRLLKAAKQAEKELKVRDSI